ncbi:MAG: DUF2652 domain-containing protein [Chloroflexota bacterium]
MTKIKSKFGYLLLADISGFSSYLVGVELEHAGGVLQKLLEGVAGQIEPVFNVQGFDIDSVFAYVPEEGMNRFEYLYKLIESTYNGFKSNLLVISDQITCTCAACRNVTSLDLKFIVHYGEYILASVKEKELLIGSDPTFVRNRNWKESVAASVGWRGYVLFTETCLAHLHLPIDEFQGEEFEYDQIRMFGSELKSEGS